MTARLADPDGRYRESFLDAMAEFAAEGRAGDRTMLGDDLDEWSGRWETDAGFTAYVEQVLADRVTPHVSGFVPCTTLWWVDGSTFLGRIAVRHTLTPRLREVGGHVGYDVRVGARRRGHATAMLRSALPVAAGLGVDPALVTCSDTNVASRRVIESAGGVLEDQRGATLRFWVPTR